MEKISKTQRIPLEGDGIQWYRNVDFRWLNISTEFGDSQNMFSLKLSINFSI